MMTTIGTEARLFGRVVLDTDDAGFEALAALPAAELACLCTTDVGAFWWRMHADRTLADLRFWSPAGACTLRSIDNERGFFATRDGFGIYACWIVRQGRGHVYYDVAYNYAVAGDAAPLAPETPFRALRVVCAAAGADWPARELGNH